jgi:hypothetical protein
MSATKPKIEAILKALEHASFDLVRALVLNPKALDHIPAAELLGAGVLLQSLSNRLLHAATQTPVTGA